MSYRQGLAAGPRPMITNCFPRLNGLGGENTPAVRDMAVGGRVGEVVPLYSLDAAITPHGIPSSESSRVPDAIRRTLTESGAAVQLALWGGGEGYESTRGRIYVKWTPTRRINAVDYADIARRVFQAAAEGFPAGAQLVMSRYRVLRPWPLSDLYVYPVGGPIPASAPEVARRSSVIDLPLPPPADEPPMGIESDFARFAATVERDTKIPLWGWGLIAGGTAITIGSIVYWGTRKRPVAANRRRRR